MMKNPAKHRRLHRLAARYGALTLFSLALSLAALPACSDDASPSLSGTRAEPEVVGDASSPLRVARSSDPDRDERTTTSPPTRPVQAPGAGSLLANETNTIEVFEAVAPATVHITQKRSVRRGYGYGATSEVQAGSGTGFIWDDQGHIVTNFHVVDGGDAFEVTLFNQKTYEATFVGGEPRKDIAVLKIDAPADELIPVRLPRLGYRITVGQKTLAIGNPFGLDHTLTTGIVSAMGREIPGYGGVTIRDMIQTDASINPGNSGGPLLNSAGELMGMNTMIYSQTGSSAGIGFAVPVTVIRRMVPQIVETGKAVQVGLGISILSDDMARRAGIEGVAITAVVPDSPAAAAGLRALQRGQRQVVLGDVIVGIDDERIESYDDLYNALDTRDPGEKVTVKLLRDGKKVEVEVELYELP